MQKSVTRVPGSLRVTREAMIRKFYNQINHHTLKTKQEDEHTNLLTFTTNTRSNRIGLSQKGGHSATLIENNI